MSDEFGDACETAAGIIRDSDTVLIGAANGMSISEGLNLFAEDGSFRSAFPGIASRHGARSIIQACFARLPPEEDWALWAGLIDRHCIRGDVSVSRVLRGIVGDRRCLVVTTNGEGHFQAAGFPDGSVCEMEGDWMTMQCARGCHDGIYPVADVVRNLVPRIVDDRVPSELVPRCPRCGGPMRVRVQGDGPFVPDPGLNGRLSSFLEGDLGDLAILELGVGPRNRLARGPLAYAISRNAGRTGYVAVNAGAVAVPQGLGRGSVAVRGDLRTALSEIASRLRCPPDPVHEPLAHAAAVLAVHREDPLPLDALGLHVEGGVLEPVVVGVLPGVHRVVRFGHAAEKVRRELLVASVGLPHLLDVVLARVHGVDERGRNGPLAERGQVLPVCDLREQQALHESREPRGRRYR